MSQKTILLVDDEQAFLEALEDALTFEGFRVLKARDVSTAMTILEKETVHLVTIDVMLSPGEKLEGKIDPQRAGIFLCEHVSRSYPDLGAFCLSVVNDEATIRQIQSFGIRFLRKGETPLRTVLGMMRSRLTGTAYSTDWRGDR